MAGRRHKVGLDYFELDCFLDNKIRLIQAEFGLKGFAVVVKLYQKIYGENGYFCEWNEDVLLLFMSENGVSSDSKNLINDIVSACVRRDIFSEEIFDKYGVLTSAGIQRRYLEATSKREKIELKKEYLLLSAPEFNKNVIINSIYGGRNAINDVGNAQSRVEKSRVEKSSTDSTAPPATNKPAYDLNEIDELYKKYGKDFVDERINRIDNYPSIKNRMATLKKWCEEDFNNPAGKSKGSKYSNSFNDFPQREYSEQELEEIAMKKRGG